MISYLEGTIIHRASNYIILKTKDGIGYKIFIIFNEIPNSEPQKNSNYEARITKLFIYHYIKEDRQNLYGFETLEKLEIFETLIGISGVGPKTAMLIVTQYSSKEIKQAIEKENLVFFQSIKGLGKKTAGKILLELKGKTIFEQETTMSTKNLDILDALMSLGYQKKDLLKTMEQIPRNLETSEDKIKWILKNSGK